MKTRATTLVALLCLVLARTAISAPVTGSIDINGNATLDADAVESATQITIWNTNTTGNPTGVFTNIPNGSSVSFSPAVWLFTSGPVTNFWSVGGFTFDLTSSTIALDNGGFLDVSLTGTISGNGYDTTACVGFFQTSDAAAPVGGFNFSEGMSFGAVAAPPCLTLLMSDANTLTILWPAASYNYTLQQNCDLTTTNWIASNFPITNSAGTNFCTVSPLTGNLFFRLSQ